MESPTWIHFTEESQFSFEVSCQLLLQMITLLLRVSFICLISACNIFIFVFSDQFLKNVIVRLYFPYVFTFYSRYDWCSSIFRRARYIDSYFLIDILVYLIYIMCLLLCKLIVLWFCFQAGRCPERQENYLHVVLLKRMHLRAVKEIIDMGTEPQ